VNVRLARRAILAGLVAVFPCYVILPFCHGLLPVGAAAIQAVRLLLITLADPAALVLLAPLVIEAAIYMYLLHKVAGWLARSIERNPGRARVALFASVIAGIALIAVPINAYDCMDGHGVKRCSALHMYVGWVHKRPITAPYVEPQCGDFGW
jgi:hypothetical protein